MNFRTWWKIWVFWVRRTGILIACPLFAIEFAYKRESFNRHVFETGWILQFNPRFWPRGEFKDVIATTCLEVFAEGKEIRVVP